MKGKLNLLFCCNNPHFFYCLFSLPEAHSESIKANTENLRIAESYWRSEACCERAVAVVMQWLDYTTDDQGIGVQFSAQKKYLLHNSCL
jgi:hypothetical protein